MGRTLPFIQAENFSEDSLRKSLSSLKISQLQLLETCLHAFELLGRLSGSGIPFLFKGGTSLLLHTGELRRISTDIDIVTPVNGVDLLSTLSDLAAGDPFLSFDEHGRGLRGLPNRRHFRYYYRPVSDPSVTIPVLLDVVEDDFSSQTIWRGIAGLVNHVAGGSLGYPQVFEMAGKVAYLAAALGSVSPEAHSKPVPPDRLADLKGLKIEGSLRFLNPIGGASPLGLFYWSEAAKLAPEPWIKA
jgi:hypothetical protein